MILGPSRGKASKKRRSNIWALTLFLLVAACQDPVRENRLREEGWLNRLAGDYFSSWVRFYPVEATKKGYHEFDSELGSYSGEDFQKRLAWLRNFRQRLLGIDATILSPSAYIDWLLLTSAVKGEIYELAEARNWTHSPLFYGKTIRDGIQCLLSADGLSTIQTQALVSRLNQIPSFLNAARLRIEAPPRILVEEGVKEIKRCQGIVEVLPAALEESLSPQDLAALGQKGRLAARALREFVIHLETNILPTATASFGQGSERLGLLLRYGEMEDSSLDDIRQDAADAIRETQEKMKNIAARMETAPSLANVLAGVSNDHLPEAELLPRVQRFLEEVMAFVSEHGLVSHVDESSVSVIEAPLHFRYGEFVALGSAGPLEQNPKPNLFILTMPLPSSPPHKVDNHLRALSTRLLRLVVIRDVFPGKHLHDSYLAASKSRIRKLLASKAHREGWGLYVEQLLIEEGYAWEDALLRLFQLHRGLVELCRLVVVIDLHVGAINLPEAIQYFSEEAYLGGGRSRQEARLAAVNPKKWSAALGKLQILKLREQYSEHSGEPGALGNFNDTLLTNAGLPLTLINIER